MASSLLIFLTVMLCAAPAFGQLSSLLLGSLFGDEFELDEGFGNGGLASLFSQGGGSANLNAGGASSSASINQLNRRLLVLERNIQTGAIGGCESGVLGPFNAAQNIGQIRFRGRFLTPPAITLAVSDVVVNDPATPLNFQIRPTGVTNIGAQVTLTDNGNNLAGLYVSYMACPSNSNIPLRA